MARLRTPKRHLHLGTPYDRRATEAFTREPFPFCAQFTGNPGSLVNGSPGALSSVTWTPNTNPIYDPYFMITPATTTIRIPWDGFYDFWMVWNVADNVATTESFACIPQSAPASDSGYGAPSFSNIVGTQTKLLTQGTSTLDTNFMCVYRGVELHANDLVRFQARVWGTQTLTATTVTAAEFHWVAPIPVKRK